jgi:hypothetical protein
LDKATERLMLRTSVDEPHWISTVVANGLRRDLQAEHAARTRRRVGEGGRCDEEKWAHDATKEAGTILHITSEEEVEERCRAVEDV